MQSRVPLALALGAVAGITVAVAGAHPRHPARHVHTHVHTGRLPQRGTVTARAAAARWEDGHADGGTDATVASIVAPAVSSTGARVLREPTRTEAARAELARMCRGLGERDSGGRWISADDLGTTLGPVRGDDLLALVNRSPRFGLDPAWAPDDLVDLATGRPSDPEDCQPPDRQCMRREAAEALGRMLAAMAREGVPGFVHSAFRSFGAQCGVFRKWAYEQGEGFCGAARSSALAGHSQHQLGTALDLFTEAWSHGGVVMRAGFGCTPGGRWLAAHAWEYGYVLPYPLPVDRRAPGSTCTPREDARDGVDPRTGYTYEPWHLRYLGADSAVRFHTAVEASGPGTGAEITLEQWLRRASGIDGDADLPTCDGCACGLCETFHSVHPGGRAARGPCGDAALLLGPDGEPVAASAPPRLLGVRAVAVPDGVRIEALVDVPPRTVTQTPAVTVDGPRYALGAATVTLSPVAGGPGHAYPDIHGAWRLAVDPEVTEAHGVDRRWPWRVALRDDAAAVAHDGANLRLPALAGRLRVTLVVPSASPLRVALVRDGQATEVTTVRVEGRVEGDARSAERDLTAQDPRGR